MIKIHNHDIFLNFEDRTIQSVSAGIHHRNCISRKNHLLIELAVNDEHIFIQFKDMFLISLSVSIITRYYKFKFISGFQTFQFCLERR